MISKNSEIMLNRLGDVWGPNCIIFLFKYCSRFNTDKYLATRAILDIHNRACYELYADILMVTNAIKNSLPVGQEEVGPMGLMTVTPSSSGHTIAKSAITNASFRTKKLPGKIHRVISL